MQKGKGVVGKVFVILVKVQMWWQRQDSLGIIGQLVFLNW